MAEVYGTKANDDGTLSAVVLASVTEDANTSFFKTSDDERTVIIDGTAALGVEGVLSGVDKNDPKKGKINPKGIIRKTVYDTFNKTSVPIPANFAGLEAAMVPTRLQDQLFRIVEVVEDEDCVTVTARHVWYDNLKNYTLWAPNKTATFTGAAACRNILTNAISPCASRVASDCKTEILGKKLDFERKNLVEAFLDPENGLCKKYGLSLIRNNWDFYCLEEVGYDRGFIIQDGKNLLGVERKESIENLATRVAPIGKDEKGKIVWLNYNGKKYVDSSHIGDYACPYVEIYDTGLQIGKGGVTSGNINTKLRQAAQRRFTKDHVDIPEVEMTVEFLSLGDTEEYRQYRGLDKVYLFDILTVVDKARGYSYTAQVNGVEHDVLTGQLLSVTIGELKAWNGTRKVATWQVPEVDGGNIRLASIMEGSYAEGSIQSDDIGENVILYAHIATATIDELKSDAIEAVTANIQEIIAGQITADAIAAESVDAINAKLGTAAIADAEIANANISFAQIKDADVQSLIAHDAVTDRYFIDKLAVNNVQAVHSQVGELIVKASDDHYYRLDIDANGELSATDVTSTLTPAEITAGETADGKSSIIETDLTANDLSASNLKAINALISKLTASRIDVTELFARQATINALNTTNISSNQSISIAVREQLNQGKHFMQANEPTNPLEGDIWYKLVEISGSKTWDDMAGVRWSEVQYGKNLLDDSGLKRGYYGQNGGYSGNTKYISYMVALPAGTYTFSTDLPDCYITRYLVDDVNHGVSAATQSITFTLDADATFKITTRNKSTTEIGTITPHAQIEVGSSPTAYVPYVGHGIKWGELSADFYETYRYNGEEWVQTESYTDARVGSLIDPDEGVITGIKFTHDGLLLEGEKYIKMQTGEETNMELSRDGITMNTAGKAFIHAKDDTSSGIIFGTDVRNAKFAVDVTGDLYAKSVSTESLTLGGAEMPIIVVDANQPSGHNILWVKPTSSVSKQWGVKPSNRKLDNTGGTLGYYRDYTISYNASDYMSGSLYYGIRARMYAYDNSSQTGYQPLVHLKARLKNGNSWIDLGSVAKRLTTDGYITLDVDLTTVNSNVMNVSGGNFTVRIETDYSPTYCQMANENIVLRARSTSTAGVYACDMFYIN